MTTHLRQFAAISGELAKNLWGRTDFEKYDNAYARAHNWIVDYRGGLFSRPGQEFCDVLQWTRGQNVKLVEFQYSPDTENTYVVIFTDDRVRFVQDGAYVLESTAAVSGVTNGSANRIVITTSGAHGYSNGDWVKLSGFDAVTTAFLNGWTVVVTDATATTFTIRHPIGGAYITRASIGTDTGSVARVYTVTSPYGEEDLPALKAYQVRDYLRLTHPSYPVKNLIRNGATSWAISNEVIGGTAAAPTGLAGIDRSSDEDYCYVYQVTAVNEAGEESLPDIEILIDAPSLFSGTGKRIQIEWNAVAGAVYYNVYRSNGFSSADGARVTPDCVVGYIGRSIGTVFNDPGITSDLTRLPPVAYNPFANGAIQHVSVTTAGTGYAFDSVITWPSGGSGAYGFLSAEADDDSEVYGVIILNPGSGYTGTAVTAADGSSFAGVATLSPASGNNPHCSCLFQQRMVYGATDNFPLRLFGSRSGLLSNFNGSDIVTDDDAYEFDISTEKVAPIRHLMNVRGGLLVFNQIGVWLVYGQQDNNLNPNNARADPQNSAGASLVSPIYVKSEIAYVSDAGQEILQLIYSDNAKVFGEINISILSNHLFSYNNPINSLSYSEVPSKVLYATQSNGQMVALTIDQANKVYACTPQWTRGYYRYCLNIEESNRSALYVAVERDIDGDECLFLERVVDRNYRNLEDSFCVDAGLQLGKTAPAGILAPNSFTGAVTFNVLSATPFSAGDVGKVLRCGAGMATITGYTDSNTITGTWTRDLEETRPETTLPARFTSGNWWLDSPTTTVSGLWHMLGEDAAILADGVVAEKTVNSFGQVTLDAAASRVVAGFGYSCIAQTLPPTAGQTVIEGKDKSLVGVAFRKFQTDKVKMGADLDDLKEIADRLQRIDGSANALKDAMVYEPVKTDFNKDSQIYIVQDQPVPAAILNVIRDVDLGDDDN